MKSYTKLYSFIIPHKDSPDLLQRCIRSIPRRPDVEIIIVDHDSDKNIVNWDTFDFDDSRCIKLVHSHDCKSAGCVRNQGLPHVNGKWLLFADCDDYYTKDFLNELDPYSSSELDVLYFNADCVDCYTGESLDTISSLQGYVSSYKENHTWLEYIKYKSNPPWCKMVRKSFIDKYQIRFEDVVLGNDIWFSYQVGYFSKRIDVLDKKIYVYTKNPKSISNFRTIDRNVAEIAGYVKMNNFFKFIGHPEWHISVLGYVKYNILHTKNPFSQTIAYIRNAWMMYKNRNLYIVGILEKQQNLK